MALPSIHWLSSIAEDSVEQLKRHNTAITETRNNDLYLHGGFKLSKSGKKITFYNDIWKISVQDSQRLKCVKISSGHGDVPEARAYHHLHLFENLLILFGGKSNLNEASCIPGTYQFDVLVRKWTHVKASGEEPEQVYNTSNMIESQLVVFGGHSNGVLSNTTFVYDIMAQHWHRATVSGAPPSPRCEHAAAAVGQSLYVFGGTGGQGCFYNDLHQLDTATLQWSRVPVEGHLLPMPRAGHSLTAHQSKDLFLFGGYNDCVFPDGGPVQEPLMKFSLYKRTWKVPSALPASGGQPENLIHHGAWIHRHMCYIFGGAGLEDSASLIRIFRIINPKKRKEYLAALNQCENEEDLEWDSEAHGQHSLSRMSSARSSARSLNPRPFSVSYQGGRGERQPVLSKEENDRAVELLMERMKKMDI
ncbi:hypothetical protein BOX15_Mlig010874g1 [Macrostomum lignano]|uniref:Kelch domain-containing protein 10 n=2 Tax=Macrostomum lignano TaxID=282301 RepID=A0A1I8GDU5_9PLAT|nr:hypothetical protein BOX15_Mlig010874g1 [Macrostomum lignano]